MVYTGIGSRRSTTEAEQRAEAIAGDLCRLGWTCRSGHASGMDQAWERGARESAEVYLPWPEFEVRVPIRARYILYEPTERAYEIAAQYHPVWPSLTQGAKNLHARNVHQVLGQDCETRTKFVLCWTPNGAASGGTRQAVRIAQALAIPVLNIAVLRDDQLWNQLEFLGVKHVH
jgi:hypothetical protein